MIDRENGRRFVATYPVDAAERIAVERIVGVLCALDPSQDPDTGCALVDLVAHGEIVFTDGRVVGASDQLEPYLSELFEMLTFVMPEVELTKRC